MESQYLIIFFMHTPAESHSVKPQLETLQIMNMKTMSKLIYILEEFQGNFKENSNFH